MILQALYEYSQRKAEEPRSNFAPEGFIERNIDFFIVIKDDGSYVTIESQQEEVQRGKSKKLVGKPFFVPAIDKQAVKHTMAGDDANLLWDNASFVFGLGKNGEKKRDAFVNTILNAYSQLPTDVGAVVNFYEKELSLEKPFSKILSHPQFSDSIISGDVIITFKIDGEFAPVIESEHVAKAVLGYQTTKDFYGCCSITGQSSCVLEPTHWAVKGILGAQTSGANLVSFNSSAYCSYGKEQSINAPVSRRAAMEYTKALQYLINSEKNKVRLADLTIVFWAQKGDVFEEFFPFFVGIPQDHTDARVRAIKSFYESVQSGHKWSDSEQRFYVLGLSPNAARISVRFWQTGTIADLAKNIRQHFDDLDIVRPLYDEGLYSMYCILLAMVREINNVPPNLTGQIFRAVITGGLYPATMLQQTIRRVRATQAKELKDESIQASILKAYLNRFSRIYKTKEKEITVALDPSNNNPGYRLGRLFAVLEKIQEESQGITTIRDRFYGAASSTPVTVFPQLLKLKNHHLSKLENAGRRVNFERMLTGVFEGIGNEMPSHLSMEDQARFAIGYYHQRQNFFKKKDSDNNNEIKGE